MIPYFKQETDYTCGPACMRMLLASKGISLSEKELAEIMNTNSEVGTKCAAFVEVAKKFGLTHIEKNNADISSMKKLLDDNWLVAVTFFLRNEGESHFAIVKDLSKDSIRLIDPFVGPEHVIKHPQFEQDWFSNFEDKKNWLFAVKQ